MEIVSPSSHKMDEVLKLQEYRKAGVREYWIVDAEKQKVRVYLFGDAECMQEYSFEEEIPVGIFEDMKIRLG